LFLFVLIIIILLFLYLLLLNTCRQRYFKQKYGIDNVDSTPMAKNMKLAAEKDGIFFNFCDMIPNTSAAHSLLIELESDSVKQNALQESLFKLYFEKAQNIGKIEVLKQACKEAQVFKQQKESDNEDEDKKLEQFITELAKKHQKTVKAKDDEAKFEMDVTGVPFFIFNKQYTCSGAQPVEALVKIFSRLLK